VVESAGNVAEVGRGTQQVAVNLEHLHRRHGERRSPHDLDALDFGVGRQSGWDLGNLSIFEAGQPIEGI
jgi:hypothetical protein